MATAEGGGGGGGGGRLAVSRKNVWFIQNAHLNTNTRARICTYTHARTHIYMDMGTDGLRFCSLSRGGRQGDGVSSHCSAAEVMGLLGRNLAGGVQPAGEDAVPLLNEAWQVQWVVEQ